jgi:hypothetical protein
VNAVTVAVAVEAVTVAVAVDAVTVAVAVEAVTVAVAVNAGTVAVAVDVASVFTQKMNVSYCPNMNTLSYPPHEQNADVSLMRPCAVPNCVGMIRTRSEMSRYLDITLLISLSVEGRRSDCCSPRSESH